MTEEKIVYSIEVIRKGKKLECRYDNYMQDSDDNLGVLKLLWIEINKILADDITEFSVGNKGDPNFDKEYED